jgi:hypothetical protein
MFYAITTFGTRPAGLPRFTTTEARARAAIARADAATPSACLRAGVRIREVATRRRAMTLDASSSFLPGERTV